MKLHSITQKESEEIRESIADEVRLQDLSDFFKILCDPTRLRIVLALVHSELCVHDLAVLIQTSESNASHQLRLLRNMKLVKFRREGKQVFYSIDDDHIVRFLEDVREHLEEQ